LHNALQQGARPYDWLWFSLDPVPAVPELAARYGDAQGQRVHFSAESLRYRWLDQAQQAARRLPDPPE
jgi:hypothetical protein